VARLRNGTLGALAEMASRPRHLETLAPIGMLAAPWPSPAADLIVVDTFAKLYARGGGVSVRIVTDE
jgi:hypothetical protein